jgi:hypothetical protein
MGARDELPDTLTSNQRAAVSTAPRTEPRKVMWKRDGRTRMSERWRDRVRGFLPEHRLDQAQDGAHTIFWPGVGPAWVRPVCGETERRLLPENRLDVGETARTQTCAREIDSIWHKTACARTSTQESTRRRRRRAHGLLPKNPLGVGEMDARRLLPESRLSSGRDGVCYEK